MSDHAPPSRPVPRIPDGFAGPGGVDEGLRMVGREDVVGIEWDAAACETARANGHLRVRADISKLDPIEFAGECCPEGVEGIHMSPPCTSYSMAGKGKGREQLDVVVADLKCVAQGLEPVGEYSDPTTSLVLEPIRWVREIRPDWLTLEQVPGALPVWQAMQPILEEWGYSVAVGILNAEQYGVPQTRRRAILVASRAQEVSLPKPTHSRYYSRNPEKLDEGALRWVSMFEALSRGFEHRSSPTVSSGGTRTGGAEVFDNRKLWEGPAEVMREQGWGLTERPAFTVTTGSQGGGAGCEWGGAPVRKMLHGLERDVQEGKDVPWVPNGRPQSKPNDAIRVQVHEAGILQTFPVDYIWCGTKTKQYEQVGNAVPPLLAEHFLRSAGADRATLANPVAA